MTAEHDELYSVCVVEGRMRGFSPENRRNGTFQQPTGGSHASEEESDQELEGKEEGSGQEEGVEEEVVPAVAQRRRFDLTDFQVRLVS